MSNMKSTFFSNSSRVEMKYYTPIFKVIENQYKLPYHKVGIEYILQQRLFDYEKSDFEWIDVKIMTKEQYLEWRIMYE
jgi:hypothetical protein